MQKILQKFCAILIAIFSILIEMAYTSYCGQSAIPFSLEIRSNGQPVLGCARPSCFGWTADGKRSADAAQFYKVGKSPDGFLRASDIRREAMSSRLSVMRRAYLNSSAYQPQFSICDRSYSNDQCTGATWVGGIAPVPKINPINPLRLMCCSYSCLSDVLTESQVEVHSNQAVIGGERTRNGRQYAFEYIANIQRLFDRSGPIYVVTTKSFPCVPQPVDRFCRVEDNANEFLVANLNAGRLLPLQQTQNGQRIVIPPQPIALAPASKLGFGEQKFEIPEVLPQEDAAIQKVEKPADKSADTEYAEYEEESANALQVNPSAGKGVNEKSLQSIRPVERRLRQRQLNRQLKASEFGSQTAYNGKVAINEQPQQFHKQQTQDSKYQQEQQQNQYSSYSLPIQSQPVENNYNYYQPTEKQTQTTSSYNNYNSPVNFGQQQQVQQLPYMQQLQSQFSSLLDPFGLFKNINAQQQQQPTTYQQLQQQYTANNAHSQYDDRQSHQYTQQNQQQQSHGQQQYQRPFTLAPARELVGNLEASIGEQMKPLLSSIPTPEDLEKAISPTGQQLLSNVARTLLGFHKLAVSKI